MQQKNKRSSYKRITSDIRKDIIRRFQAEDTLKQIAKDVGLNVSTCKGIIKVYQEEGRIGKKLKRNRPIRVIQTFSYFQIDKGQIKRIESPKIQQKEIFVQKNKNMEQTLMNESKLRANEYFNQWLQNHQRAGETDLVQPQQNFTNVMAWQNYQSYQGFQPWMNWFIG